MAKHRHVVDGYSLVFTHGTRYFALHPGGAAGRAFFTRYRDAVAFKRELKKERLLTSVVKVRVTMVER